MTDLSILEHLHTDIDVAPPEEYADSTTVNLLPEGTYDLIIRSFEPILDKDNPDVFKGFNVQAEVASGPYEGRGTGRLAIWAATYQRSGVTVSQLGDFIRSIDYTATWSGAAGAGKVLQMAQDRKMPFRVKLGWEAYDGEKYEELGGKRMVKKSPEEKAARKEATIRGMKNFPQNPDGSYRAEVEGVNGQLLEGRLTINNFVSSHKRK
jgi:hypothetical protein